MIPEYFAIVGSVVASSGGFYYLYETIKGSAKPNRVSWLLWGLFPTIIFIAQKAQGVQGVTWLTFAAGFTPLLIVVASFFNTKAYWKTQPSDYVLMAFAIAGIIAWFVTNVPNLAILFAILADLCAGIPTLIKAFKHPETESWVAYAISATGFGIGILAIQAFNFQSSAFAIYLVAMEGSLAILSLRKVKSPKSAL